METITIRELVKARLKEMTMQQLFGFLSSDRVEIRGVMRGVWVILLFPLVGMGIGGFAQMAGIIWLFAILELLLLVFFCFVYYYFMTRKPDYLRSEKFHITKEAVSLLGDSSTPIPKAEMLRKMLSPDALPSNQTPIPITLKKTEDE